MSLGRPINLRLDRVKFAFFGGGFGPKMTPNGLFGGTPGPAWVDFAQTISQSSLLHSRQSRYTWFRVYKLSRPLNLRLDRVTVASLGAFLGQK